MTRSGFARAMVLNAPTSPRRWSAVVAATIVLSIASLLTEASLAAPAHAANQQHRLLRLTNEARHRHGTHAVRLRGRMSHLARRHSRRMARTQSLFHSSGLSHIGRAWGENVGYTYRSVRSVHRAFMRSTSHRSNILASRYHRIGLGLFRSHGRLWVTEIFAS